MKDYSENQFQPICIRQEISFFILYPLMCVSQVAFIGHLVLTTSLRVMTHSIFIVLAALMSFLYLNPQDSSFYLFATFHTRATQNPHPTAYHLRYLAPKSGLAMYLKKQSSQTGSMRREANRAALAERRTFQIVGEFNHYAVDEGGPDTCLLNELRYHLRDMHQNDQLLLECLIRRCKSDNEAENINPYQAIAICQFFVEYRRLQSITFAMLFPNQDGERVDNYCIIAQAGMVSGRLNTLMWYNVTQRNTPVILLMNADICSRTSIPVTGAHVVRTSLHELQSSVQMVAWQETDLNAYVDYHSTLMNANTLAKLSPARSVKPVPWADNSVDLAPIASHSAAPAPQAPSAQAAPMPQLVQPAPSVPQAAPISQLAQPAPPAPQLAAPVPPVLPAQAVPVLPVLPAQAAPFVHHSVAALLPQTQTVLQWGQPTVVNPLPPIVTVLPHFGTAPPPATVGVPPALPNLPPLPVAYVPPIAPVVAVPGVQPAGFPANLPFYNAPIPGQPPLPNYPPPALAAPAPFVGGLPAVFMAGDPEGEDDDGEVVDEAEHELTAGEVSYRPFEALYEEFENSTFEQAFDDLQPVGWDCGLFNHFWYAARSVLTCRDVIYLPSVPDDLAVYPNIVSCPVREEDTGLHLIARQQTLPTDCGCFTTLAALFQHSLSHSMLSEVSTNSRCLHGVSNYQLICPSCHGFPAGFRRLLRFVTSRVGDATSAHYFECGPTNPQTAFMLQKKWGIRCYVYVSERKLPVVTQLDGKPYFCYLGGICGITRGTLIPTQTAPEGVYYWDTPTLVTFGPVSFWRTRARLAVGAGSANELNRRDSTINVFTTHFINAQRYTKTTAIRRGKRLCNDVEEIVRYKYIDLGLESTMLRVVDISFSAELKLQKYLCSSPQADVSALARTLLQSEQHPIEEIRAVAVMMQYNSTFERKRPVAYHSNYFAKRVFGDPIPYALDEKHSTKACICCGGYPPLRYRWVGGLCPHCHAAAQLSRAGIQTSGVAALRAADIFDFEATSVRPTHLVFRTATPVYPKEKDVLPEFYMTEKDARAAWKDAPRHTEGPFPELYPFFEPPKYVRADDAPPTAALTDVGILHRLHSTIFRATSDVLCAAVKFRLFSKPKHEPDAHTWALAHVCRNLPALNLIPSTPLRPLRHASERLVQEAFGENGVVPRHLLPAYREWVAEESFVTPCDLNLDVQDAVHPHIHEEAWLDKFPTNRRIQLWTALSNFLQGRIDEGERRGVDPSHVADDWRQCYGEVTAFVKTEQAANGQPVDCEGGPSRANPRAINAPHDMAHHFVGRIMRRVTSFIHERWNSSAVLFYAGGASPETLDGWINQFAGRDGHPSGYWSGHVFIATDYTSYDCTQSNYSLHFMEQLYANLGVVAPNFWRTLRAWRQPTGVTSAGGRFRAQCMMASGRDDTAAMNGVLNGVAQYCAWSVVLTGSWPHEDTAKRAWLDSNLRIAILGDDSLSVVPGLDINGRPWSRQDFIAQIARFGFETKLEETADAYCAVFLGCRPYPTATGLSWGPTIGRRVFKHHTAQTLKVQDFFAWLRGVVTAELVQFAHVPLLREIAYKVDHLLQGHSSTPLLLVKTSGLCNALVLWSLLLCMFHWIASAGCMESPIRITGNSWIYCRLCVCCQRSSIALQLIRPLASTTNSLDCSNYFG